MIKYLVDVSKKKVQIDKNIYGHFSEHLGRCIYEGLFVGEDSKIPNKDGMRIDVMDALKAIKIPVLRWPGGCFADEYHWKDGIGPKENRKKMINTHWGGGVEDNSFGTHEFLHLCELIGCEPYINGNLGSGTVQEMSEWVEYMNFDGLSPMAKLREENGRKEPWNIKYFGIGNENWGCGGNMRPEYYSDLYRQFATYVRNYGDNKIYKIACGPSDGNYNWTKVLMENAAPMMDALTLHYYTIPGDSWNEKGSATMFDEKAYYKTLEKTLKMDEFLTQHSAIMDKLDPKKKVAIIVDEWGTWYDVETGSNPGYLYQQNTMRDALVAGINLNIFNKHADRVKMANIAQMVNVLQAVILTEGDKMILTPTYHVFEMYSDHQNNDLVESYMMPTTVGVDDIQVSNLVESASVNSEGSVILTICNLDLTCSKEVDVLLEGITCKLLSGEIITNCMDAHNTFESPEVVKKMNFEDMIITEDGFKTTLPPCSITKIIVKGK